MTRDGSGHDRGEVAYVTVQGHMSPPETIVHTVLILLTCGLWLPFYWARKRKIRQTSTTYRVGGQ